MMKLLLCVIWSLILLGWQDNTNAALNADNTGAPPIQDEPASEPVSDSTAAATSGAKQEQERAVDPDATDDQANTPSALPPSPAGAGAGAGAASKTSGQSDAAGEDEEEEDLGLTWTWIFTIIAMSFVSNKMLALVSGKSQQTILYRAAENLRRHGRLVLVLDLDETLVHCEVSPIESYDMRVESTTGQPLFVRKRPHVDVFLSTLSQLYEVVIFTASVQSYADPVIDRLDTEGLVSRRYYRESCRQMGGVYVKDLSILGNDLARVAIMDNSPECYQLQPENAVPCQTWLEDPDDNFLLNAIPFLQTLATVADVRSVLSLRLPPNVHEMVDAVTKTTSAESTSGVSL